VLLNVLSANGAFVDANVGNAKPVTVTGLTISGVVSPNYSLTQPTPTASITAKALTAGYMPMGGVITRRNDAETGTRPGRLIRSGATR